MQPWEMNYGGAEGSPAPEASGAMPWEMNYGGAENSASTSAPSADNGPGFFERTGDRIVQGASDLMTTAMEGDFEDDATPRFQSPAERMQSGIAQTGQAIGEIGVDAVISAGKSVLDEETQDSIASGFKSVMESAPAKAVGSAIDAGSEAIGPDASRRVGELVEMAAFGLPKAKIPGKGSQRALAKEAKKWRGKQEKVVKGRREDKVQEMMEPEDGYGRGETELNAAGTSRYTPTEKEAAVIKAVSDLPSVRPGRSLRFNEAKIAKAAREEVEAVNGRITRAGNPKVDTDVLNSQISEAFVDVEKQGFPMTGDVEKSAERLIERARKFIEDSDGTANGVLQARRDFDTWAKLNKPGVYSETSESALGIAAKVVRDTLNDHVDALVPSAKVKPSLEKTHLLLKAKEDLRPRAAKTAKTKIGRMGERLKGHMPTTPLAQWSTAGAAWAVATQPVVAAIAALAGTGYVGAKALQYGTREWRGGLAKAISAMEKVLKAGEAPAKVLSAMRADKLALVEMLKDEREHKDEEE